MVLSFSAGRGLTLEPALHLTAYEALPTTVFLFDSHHSVPWFWIQTHLGLGLGFAM